jgi:ribosomal protein S18 acetylase RimI-like enzyme
MKKGKLKGKGGYLILENGEKIPVLSWEATESTPPGKPQTKVADELTFSIAYMHPCHIATLLPIERSFTDPWQKRDFMAAIHDHHAVCKVAIVNDRPVAYAVWGLEKDKLYLIRMAVRNDLQRCSIGSAMMQETIKRLSPDRRTEAWTRVDERNVPAQLFLSSMGWVAVGIDGGWMGFVFREEWRE